MADIHAKDHSVRIKNIFANNRGSPVIGASDCLRLGAAPVFGIMALLTGVDGGSMPRMLCLAMHDASPLIGMVPMYLLMSIFHSPPWLKLISGHSRLWQQEVQ